MRTYTICTVQVSIALHGTGFIPRYFRNEALLRPMPVLPCSQFPFEPADHVVVIEGKQR